MILNNLIKTMNNENLEKLYTKSNLEINKPIIFIKKINIKSKVIPLNTINNDFRQARHFPSTTME